MNNPLRLLHLSLRGGGILLPSLTLFAQQTPASAPAATTRAEDPAVQLSPFEVRTDRDTGRAPPFTATGATN